MYLILSYSYENSNNFTVIGVHFVSLQLKYHLNKTKDALDGLSAVFI